MFFVLQICSKMSTVHFETASIPIGGFYGLNCSLPTTRDEIALPDRSLLMNAPNCHLYSQNVN